jgi:hypothetical protein
VLSVLALLLLLVSAAYFGLQFLAQTPPPKTLLLCGYGVILAAALLLSITYFDLYTPMNAPHKVSLHVALLSVMLYLIFDLRNLIGAPRPRGLGVCAAICFFFCTATGVSNAIAFLGGVYDDVMYFLFDLVTLGFAAYFTTKCLRLAVPPIPEKTEVEQ